MLKYAYNHFEAQAKTSASKKQTIISLWLQGNAPPLQQALELHSILSQSDTNLRQPVGLEEQLLMGRMASDVGKSMLQMLQVISSSGLCHALSCCQACSSSLRYGTACQQRSNALAGDTVGSIRLYCCRVTLPS